MPMNRVLRSRVMRRVGVLLLIFVAAVLAYLMLSRDTVNKEEAVYTSMEERALPIAYAEVSGRRMNAMPGYCKEMAKSVVRDSITMLPEDRNLTLYLEGGGEDIQGISYEVRSLDTERLVERTEVEDWTVEGDTATMRLPIQNLLMKDQEYRLCLAVETGGSGTVYYYTRILWSDQPYAAQMVDLAVSFTQRTFDYDQARELVTYLETDGTEDNSSLGNVNIKSSFSQLTWAGLDVRLEGEILVTLKEMDGLMGQVQLRYMASREPEEGQTEYYDVVDNFTMKWGEQRIYLMDYTREANQVFTGGAGVMNGKRLMLGIADPGRLRSSQSPNQEHTAFVSNRDLWCYSQNEEDKRGELLLLFSFKSEKNGINYDPLDQHGIEILSVEDDGSVNFQVYGYMNRGNHEGDNGMAVYRYDGVDGAIEEVFFVPLDQPYGMLRESLGRLSYLSENRQFYFLLDDTIYSVDLDSHEAMVLAEDLDNRCYAISQSQARIAWQDNDQKGGHRLIHLMNLDTGIKQDIEAGPDEEIRVLGFVADDFVYGRSRGADQWSLHGRYLEKPMYAMEIVNYEMQSVAKYESSDQYISQVSIESSRIHYKRVVRTGEDSFAYTEDDTVVCNQELEDAALAGIGWYADPERKKLYFVQLDREAPKGMDIRIAAPKKFSFSQSDRMELKRHQEALGQRYYAYGRGRYLGDGESLYEAVQLAYGSMGIVVDEDQRIIWNRVNRSNQREIRNPQVAAQPIIDRLESMQEDQKLEDGYLVMDARGCRLGQILYYVGQGIPVVAFHMDGSYSLICGYDNFNISMFDVQTGQVSKVGLNDADAYFESAYNDFVCMVFTE